MQGCNHFDWEMHRAITATYDEQQQRELLMIQAGGVWTAYSLHKAGLLADNVCPWCGAYPETLEHLWWECPELEHCREAARKHVPQGTHRELPPCLALHGLPTECSRDLNAGVWRAADSLWGYEDMDCTPVQTYLRGAQPKLTTDQNHAWQAVLEHMRDDLQDPAHMTLRQLGEYIQGPFVDLPNWELDSVNAIAPPLCH